MIILFVHFPLDNNQLESLSLPQFFAAKGHRVYSIFEKKDRNFYARHEGNGIFRNIDKKDLFSIDYDLIVCKSSAYQSYGKYFKNDKTKVINITPMGIPSNLSGVDFFFKEEEIIKPPASESEEIFKNYFDWNQRKNQIIIAASIGTDKNQIEFLNFLQTDDFPDWKIIFAGGIADLNYAKKMENICKNKSINFEFTGHLKSQDLFKIMRESKISALTTDPRPAQPFDPGPRVIFESICAGLPCIINDLVLVHQISRKFCFSYNIGNKSSFSDMIREVKSSNLERLSAEAFYDSKIYFSMENACEFVYEKITNWMKT